MRIGELAKAARTSARSLRHYEKQGLLEPARNRTGYRLYGPDAVRTVERIRWLLAAGFSTRQIREILPCVTDIAPRAITCARIRSEFQRELGRLEEQIQALEKSKRLVRSALKVSPIG